MGSPENGPGMGSTRIRLLLDLAHRQLLRGDLGCDELEWERGKAWAFEQAMGAVWYYIDSNPPMSRMGRRTLERILADESSH